MPSNHRYARLFVLVLLNHTWLCNAFRCVTSLRGVARLSLRRHASVSTSDASLSLSPSLSSSLTHKAPLHEIERRRNFAIISHPDAGKTTLTEKLLLFGGAIQDAGAVKARADQRRATSDWMEIEKQRGISVTSTVLSFQYKPSSSHSKDTTKDAATGAAKDTATKDNVTKGSTKDITYFLNLLDTPGHQDFSEDTYRTLAAADNCVMLVDAAKGVEDRTRKLFAVCKMRRLPIFTFANKLDRPAKTPFELIDELEREFSLECCPMNWPIGDGDEFQGVYDRRTHTVHLFERGDRRKKVFATQVSADDPQLMDIIGKSHYDKLQEDIDMLDHLMPEIDMDKIKNGEQTPLFFGSAMTNFGVELFLNTFLHFAHPPMAREATIKFAPNQPSSTGGAVSPVVNDESEDKEDGSEGESVSLGSSTSSVGLHTFAIPPDFEDFTGFVFKLQANLDPKHRDRMAFVRICSGVFRRGMKVQHSRLRKQINLSSAQSLFAQDRDSVDEAFPGDIIGVHNPGCFAIGDTLFTGGKRIVYPGIPSFSPERFAFIKNPNPSVYKKFNKGLNELLDEGAVQMLREKADGGNGYPLLAAVGQLQFEVVQYRLRSEYGVESSLEPIGYELARWVDGGWDAVDRAEGENKLFNVYVCKDRWERPVLLFRNAWKVQTLQSEAPYLQMTPWTMPPSEI